MQRIARTLPIVFLLIAPGSFAQELGDNFLVMDRGQVIYASTRADLDETALKRAMAI